MPEMYYEQTANDKCTVRIEQHNAWLRFHFVVQSANSIFLTTWDCEWTGGSKHGTANGLPVELLSLLEAAVQFVEHVQYQQFTQEWFA